MPDFLTFLWPVFSHEEKHNLSGITSCRKQRLKMQFDLSLQFPFTGWHQLVSCIKPMDMSTMLVQRRGPQAKQCGIEPNRDIAEAY